MKLNQEDAKKYLADGCRHIIAFRKIEWTGSGYLLDSIVIDDEENAPVMKFNFCPLCGKDLMNGERPTA